MYSYKCKENDSKAVNLRISIIPREEDGKETFKKITERNRRTRLCLRKETDRVLSYLCYNNSIFSFSPFPSFSA